MSIEKTANLLKLRPDISKGFKLIEEWEEIDFNDIEQEALEIFFKAKREGKNPLPDCIEIKEQKSIPHIVSYLRYDLKKILIRTRLFYIDNLIEDPNEKIIKPPDIECGFFEPLLFCFSFAETLGYYKYLNWNGSPLLRRSLKDLGDGYKTYNWKLTELFRHGLAHELRPHSGFNIDVNTESKYLSPYHDNNNEITINIPHFIDTLVLELEKLINNFQGGNANLFVKNYLSNLKRLEDIRYKIKVGMNSDKFQDIYIRYCSQLDKEDKQINERINWLLASQSILFAAVGMCKELNIAGSYIPKVISGVGFLSSLIIWVSVYAAIKSFFKYRDALLSIRNREQDPNNEFPQLHRRSKTLNQGFLSSKYLPLIIAFAWIVIFIVL